MALSLSKVKKQPSFGISKKPGAKDNTTIKAWSDVKDIETERKRVVKDKLRNNLPVLGVDDDELEQIQNEIALENLSPTLSQLNTSEALNTDSERETTTAVNTKKEATAIKVSSKTNKDNTQTTLSADSVATINKESPAFIDHTTEDKETSQSTDKEQNTNNVDLVSSAKSGLGTKNAVPHKQEKLQSNETAISIASANSAAGETSKKANAKNNPPANNVFSKINAPTINTNAEKEPPAKSVSTAETASTFNKIQAKSAQDTENEPNTKTQANAKTVSRSILRDFHNDIDNDSLRENLSAYSSAKKVSTNDVDLIKENTQKENRVEVKSVETNTQDTATKEPSADFVSTANIQEIDSEIHKSARSTNAPTAISVLSAEFTSSGFTKLSNSFVEKIYSSDFGKYEIKVLLCILRYTVGFHKYKSRITLRFFEEKTGIPQNRVSQTLAKLQIDNLISKNVIDRQTVEWALNDYNFADSFTAINNDYLNFIIKADLSSREYKVLSCFIRFILGYNKTICELSKNKLVELTKIADGHLSLILKQLRENGYIVKNEFSKKGLTNYWSLGNYPASLNTNAENVSTAKSEFTSINVSKQNTISAVREDTENAVNVNTLNALQNSSNALSVKVFEGAKENFKENTKDNLNKTLSTSEKEILIKNFYENLGNAITPKELIKKGVGQLNDLLENYSLSDINFAIGYVIKNKSDTQNFVRVSYIINEALAEKKRIENKVLLEKQRITELNKQDNDYVEFLDIQNKFNSLEENIKTEIENEAKNNIENMKIASIFPKEQMVNLEKIKIFKERYLGVE